MRLLFVLLLFPLVGSVFGAWELDPFGLGVLDDSDSDEELLLLFPDTFHDAAVTAYLTANQREQPERPIIPNTRYDWHAEDVGTFRLWFRFSKRHFLRLHTAFNFPAWMRTPERDSFSSEEGFLILLNRMAYPDRLFNVGRKFGRGKGQMSRIFKCVLRWVHGHWGHLLTMAGAAASLSRERLAEFARAVKNKGAALETVWGFIDGTIRAMCRPGIIQREVYNGWKRLHGLKWQSVVTPDGIIRLLSGPFSARRHDAFMLMMSNLLADLTHHFATVIQPAQLAAGLAHLVYVLYGDPAYPISQYLLAPFRGAVLTPDQQAFNSSMSTVREPVEWCFGKVLQQWPFLDFKKNLKLLLQPIGLYYVVGVILTNCHTCLYMSQTSRFFNVAPPSLEEYMQ
jgi:hypothetical protein